MNRYFQIGNHLHSVIYEILKELFSLVSSDLPIILITEEH